MREVKTLLIVVNVDWFFKSHRLPIAMEAIKKGWKVVVVARNTGDKDFLKQKGIHFIDLPIQRSGTNPLKEVQLIYSLYKIYKKMKPTVVHHVTLKPVIYGSIVSKIAQVNGVVNAISGLGYNFTLKKKTFINLVIIRLMKFAFNRKRISFIFQNEDDYQELKSYKVFNGFEQTYFIKGSGVDLQKFTYVPEQTSNKLTILFAARLLESKGVFELKKAFEILTKKYPNQLELQICGAIDLDSRDAISESFMNKWIENDEVKWNGFVKNMPKMYQQAAIIVFPSYREGMPKTLIDACASGRPIVTTNVYGCKDCVDEGVNGFKVPIKSVNELVEALERLIKNTHLRNEMGMNSRLKAEREFDVKDVVYRHLNIYSSFFKNRM